MCSGSRVRATGEGPPGDGAGDGLNGDGGALGPVVGRVVVYGDGATVGPRVGAVSSSTTEGRTHKKAP